MEVARFYLFIYREASLHCGLSMGQEESRSGWDVQSLEWRKTSRRCIRGWKEANSSSLPTTDRKDVNC